MCSIEPRPRRAYHSASLLAAGVSDLEQIARGGPPVELEHDVSPGSAAGGSGFSLRGLRSAGQCASAVEGGVVRVEPGALNADAVRALVTNAPVVDVRQDGSPGEPAFFSQAYVPVRVDGHPIAVVGAYVDHTALRDQFRTVFLAVASSLSLLTGVAFAIPAVAWYRRTREKQMADRRGDQFAEDAQAQNLRLRRDAGQHAARPLHVRRRQMPRSSATSDTSNCTSSRLRW